MWEVCPLCKGTGMTPDKKVCDVCKGKKIINETDGCPPSTNKVNESKQQNNLIFS